MRNLRFLTGVRMEAWESARNALECVLGANKGDSIVIFCDDEKIEVGEAFSTGALKLGLQTRLTALKTSAKEIRKEIPDYVAAILRKTPDIYINLFRGAVEETPFRIKLIHLETKEHKARLGHCPGVTIDMLTEGALALKPSDHRKMQCFAKKLIKKLEDASQVDITNPSGTKLSMSVQNRPFFTDTILNWKTLKWMNLPTGEVMVAPVEETLQGELVCDMAIGGIGPLGTPVKLSVKDGKVSRSSSQNKGTLERVRGALNTDERSNRVGEFAFGINEKARFIDEFLEAEKVLGTIHIAFGNNVDFPSGKNPSKNHLDFLMSKPTVTVHYKDGPSEAIVKDGVFSRI